MELRATTNNKDGKQVRHKPQMPSIGQVLNAVQEHGFFAGFTRCQYLAYNINEALAIVEAIGKSRNPQFVLDDANRFAYTNFIKWAHCDPSMQCLDPATGKVIPGRLKRGIYIAGNTGTGKSWCLDIMQAYCTVFGFKVAWQDYDDNNKLRPLNWRTVRADYLCDYFALNGNINEFKNLPSLGIQDFGQEPQETLYMGNRLDVVRQLIEYRGDRCDELTLITSNLKMQGTTLKNRYGDRVASRLNEMCNYFEIKGKDRRNFLQQ